jgi:hypothetical protein
MATRPFLSRPVRKGLWFPLALAGLLLLALPGAVLLALSLAGWEGQANAWLQRRLGLSYHNPVPPWAGLLLLALPPLLVLLYFLKLRRQPLQVPSTFLWRKSIEDLHVNSLFQWLRDNVLLLVQLLALLLLIYGVLSLQVHGRTAFGKHYILLIDSSASMAATDVSPSRLEVARQEALREIDAHGEGDTGMVIEFNSRAAILQPYTADKALLRAAVGRIRQTNRPTRLVEALALADSLANPRKSTMNSAVRPRGEDPAKARTYVDVEVEAVAAEVHLFSDGRFPPVPGFAAGNLTLHYHRVGQPGPEAVDNVGIVNFNAVRDEQDSSKLQAFVRVLNFRPSPADLTVELEWRIGGDARLRDQPLRVAARTVRAANPEKNEPGSDTPGEGVVTFDLEDIDETADVVLRARLKGLRDHFPLDDEAWLVAGVVRKARVLIVTPGNDILRDFFDLPETAQVARVSYLTPDDLKGEGKYGRPARAGEFDLVVFDRCAPAGTERLPLGNTFFIAAVPPPWQRAATEPLKDVLIRNATSNHPLMRHLTGLDEIAFAGAFRFPSKKGPPLPPRTARLLECDRETAVLLALPRQSFTDLVLTFPLVTADGRWATNWNLKLSFPVFLRNVLYGLGNVSDAAAEESVQPGQVKVLRPDAAVDRVVVTDPEGGKQPLARGSGMEFAYRETNRPGVYGVTWAGGGRSFAVNLLDADESNIQPRDEVRLGEQRLRASGQQRRQTYDTWKWVALAALLVLLVEWTVYHRRIFF